MRRKGTAIRGMLGDMALETETVLDRRSLRRRIAWWRTVAILAVAAVAGAFLFRETAGHQIARVTIEGTILENRKQLNLLERLAKESTVDAVLVYVNSPGGTTAGGEALFTALREVAKKKPVVAQFGTVAASAGYIAGLGADYIVARGNTITGSVGVIAQWPEITGLLDKLGVKINEVKSGDLKAVPSPFGPLNDRGRQVTQEMIDEGLQWFLSLVESRRGIKRSEVPGLVEGRVFSGREALRLRLVDEVGGEAEAVRWLVEKRSVRRNLKVHDWKPQDVEWSSGAGLSQMFLGWLVGDSVAQMLNETHNLATLGLDGLVSIWHPDEK